MISRLGLCCWLFCMFADMQPTVWHVPLTTLCQTQALTIDWHNAYDSKSMGFDLGMPPRLLTFMPGPTRAHLSAIHRQANADCQVRH